MTQKNLSSFSVFCPWGRKIKTARREALFSAAPYHNRGKNILSI